MRRERRVDSMRALLDPPLEDRGEFVVLIEIFRNLGAQALLGPRAAALRVRRVVVGDALAVGGPVLAVLQLGLLLRHGLRHGADRPSDCSPGLDLEQLR